MIIVLKGVAVLLFMASLSAFPVDVMIQYPQSILPGQTVTAEYQIRQNGSSEYAAFVDIQNMPQGVNASIGQTPCQYNGTFVCQGWFGSGINTVRISLSFPSDSKEFDGTISTWFELRSATSGSPQAPAQNQTTQQIVPAPVVNVTKPVPMPPPTPPAQVVKPTPPAPKPIVSVADKNLSATVTATVTNVTNSSSPVQKPQLLPPIGDGLALILAAIILIGGVVVVFI